MTLEDKFNTLNDLFMQLTLDRDDKLTFTLYHKKKKFGLVQKVVLNATQDDRGLDLEVVILKHQEKVPSDWYTFEETIDFFEDLGAKVVVDELDDLEQEED